MLTRAGSAGYLVAVGFVRRVSVIVLVATSIGADAFPQERPAVTAKLESEIAWARATWPEDLKGLRFHSPLAKLLAWAPRRGSTTVYLYANDFACRRATLVHAEREKHDDDDGSEPAPPILLAKINQPASTDDGEQVREVTHVVVGALMSRENGFTTTEARDAGGRWKPWMSGGIWLDSIVYGTLSYADDRVARWDGQPMVMHPVCSGPVEWRACPSGGERPCWRCDEVSVVLTEPRTTWGELVQDHGSRPITCRDQCPPYPESPSIARVNLLDARVEVWRPRKTPIARVPSLYKSRDDCVREHPLGNSR